MFANRSQINYVNRQICKQNINVCMCAYALGQWVSFYLHKWCRWEEPGSVCAVNSLPGLSFSEFLSHVTLFECGNEGQSEFVFTKYKAWFPSICLSWPPLLSPCILWPMMLIAYPSLAKCLMQSEVFFHCKERSWFSGLAFVIVPRTVHGLLSQTGQFAVVIHLGRVSGLL